MKCPLSTLLMLSAACSAAPTAEPPAPAAAVDAPGWLHTLPARGGELCAVGISGPTYYAEDARANSKANALSELSRAGHGLHARMHAPIEVT